MPDIVIVPDIDTPLLDCDVGVPDMEVLDIVISMLDIVISIVISVAIASVDIWEEVADASMVMSGSIRFAIGIDIIDEEVWFISPCPIPDPD